MQKIKIVHMNAMDSETEKLFIESFDKYFEDLCIAKSNQDQRLLAVTDNFVVLDKLIDFKDGGDEITVIPSMIYNRFWGNTDLWPGH